MTSGEQDTVLSVRGEARRTTAPDQASIHVGVTEIAASRPAASAAAAQTLSELLAELAMLGGEALTVNTSRSAVTWSTQSVNTHEEYDLNKRTGEHGRTGRHVAMANVLISVRDFDRLDAVIGVLTSRDNVDVHAVHWSVDDDNPEWATVRADAISAALVKGRDYASALGGSITRVEHVADAGLLSDNGPTRASHDGGVEYARASGEGHGGASLDPVPQVISAVIEARLTARVAALPPA